MSAKFIVMFEYSEDGDNGKHLVEDYETFENSSEMIDWLAENLASSLGYRKPHSYEDFKLNYIFSTKSDESHFYARTASNYIPYIIKRHEEKARKKVAKIEKQEYKYYLSLKKKYENLD